MSRKHRNGSVSDLDCTSIWRHKDGTVTAQAHRDEEEGEESDEFNDVLTLGEEATGCQSVDAFLVHRPHGGVETSVEVLSRAGGPHDGLESFSEMVSPVGKHPADVEGGEGEGDAAVHPRKLCCCICETVVLELGVTPVLVLCDERTGVPDDDPAPCDNEDPRGPDDEVTVTSSERSECGCVRTETEKSGLDRASTRQPASLYPSEAACF